MQYLNDVQRFYLLLDEIEYRCGGKHLLENYKKSGVKEVSGVYFFFDDNEKRNYSGEGLRVIRVGTSGKLRGRLRQHFGSETSIGNRSSIFRKHVGRCLINLNYLDCKTWGERNNYSWLTSAERNVEIEIEKKVNCVIRKLKFTWLPLIQTIQEKILKKNVFRFYLNIAIS